MFELQLLGDDGQPEVRVPLAAVPLYVGRAPHNHVVVAHPSVSGRHASLFVQGGVVWIEDLGSSNGTTVGGQEVKGRSRVSLEAPIRLGRARDLRVVDLGAAPAEGSSRRWLVRPVDGGAARAIDRERFRIGPEPGADLRTTAGPGVVLLLSPETGDLALGEGDEVHALDAGDVVTVGGQRLRVELADGTIAATIQVEHHPYPYVVRLQPDAQTVTLEDPAGAHCAVTAANRVALVTVLAQRLAHDRTDGQLPAHEQGWVSDEDVAIGIWGRAGRARPIKVVLCRTRAQIRESGLDGWCLEKRGAATRLRAAEVDLG